MKYLSVVIAFSLLTLQIGCKSSKKDSFVPGPAGQEESQNVQGFWGSDVTSDPIVILNLKQSGTNVVGDFIIGTKDIEATISAAEDINISIDVFGTVQGKVTGNELDIKLNAFPCETPTHTLAANLENIGGEKKLVSSITTLTNESCSPESITWNGTLDFISEDIEGEPMGLNFSKSRLSN